MNSQGYKKKPEVEKSIKLSKLLDSERLDIIYFIQQKKPLANWLWNRPLENLVLVEHAW